MPRRRPCRRPSPSSSGRTLAGLGVGHVFGVVGSGNFDVTNALRRPGCRSPPPGTRAARPRWPTRTPGCPGGSACCQRPPGLRADQRDDRDRRGRQEPHAADRAGRRHRRPPRSAPTSGSTRTRSPAASGAVRRAGPLARPPPSRTPSGPSARRVNERRTVVLNLPLDVQAAAVPGTARRRARPPSPRRRRSAPRADAVDALAAPARRRASARCSWPAAAPADARAGAARPGRARPARCWPPRRWRTGCSTASRSTSGISGGFASPLTAELISGADLMVGWGCALNMWTMRHGR